MKRSFVLVIVLLLAAVPAVAQQQYGTLAGVVLDNSQVAIPGVTVSLSGPYLQGTRSAVTDGEGRYRFVPVPPGTGYTIRFELQGFNTLEKSGVIVNLGRETQLNAEMSLSQFAETITVTAEKIVVDTSKSTVDTNVDWKLVDSLSTNRNFTTMMQMVPGVKAGNNPYVHGASNDANIYMIDGVDTSDPRTGGWSTAINWDTIQETQVQTAGFAAEYGRATGGVVNLVTKSGGNDFSFTLRGILQRADWAANGGIDKETGQKKATGGRSDENRPSITVGGPIMKDRLWFYTAYEKRSNHRDFSYYNSIADLTANTQSTGRTNYLGKYVSGKLTFQINPSHSLVGYYAEDPIDLDPLNRGWNETAVNHYAGSSELHQFQGGNNYSLQWYGVLNPNLFLEGKYQHHASELNVSPMDSAGFASTPYEREATAAGYYFYGGAYNDYRSNRDRDGGNLSASYYLDSASGSHQLKAGLEYLLISPKAGRVFNALGYYRNRAGEAPYQRFTWTDQLSGNKTDQTYQALFVQDQWKVGRASVNLGLRAEATKIENNVGDKVISFGFGKAIAPRLGFAYDLNGDSIHASLGRFYSLASNYIADYFNQIPTHQQFWQWNSTCTVSAGTRPWQYADSCWTQIYDVPTGAGSNTIDSSLKPAYVDEFTVGYDKLLSPQFAVGGSFIWRQQKYTIDAYDPTQSGEYLITNFPNSHDGLGNKFMEYQAIEINLKKRFGPDGFQFLANYTYVLKSNSWVLNWRGTVPGIAQDPDAANSLWYGKMESPQELKLNGSYTMPWKTIVGITTLWNTGQVYTPYHAGDYNNVPDGRRGSLRVGNDYQTDVHVEQPVRVGPLSLAAYFDVFNVFNQQPVQTRIGNTTSSTFKEPNGWRGPRSLQLGFKIEY